MGVLACRRRPCTSRQRAGAVCRAVLCSRDACRRFFGADSVTEDAHAVKCRKGAHFLRCIPNHSSFPGRQLGPYHWRLVTVPCVRKALTASPRHHPGILQPLCALTAAPSRPQSPPLSSSETSHGRGVINPVSRDPRSSSNQQRRVFQAPQGRARRPSPLGIPARLFQHAGRQPCLSPRRTRSP